MRDAQNKENTVNTNNLPKLAPLLGQVAGATRAVPEVSTSAMGTVGVATAVVNGNLTATGEPQPYKAGFCLSILNATPTVTTADTVYNNGGLSATGVFTDTLAFLSSNTTYYVRAYAINVKDTVYGAVTSFTTNAEVIAAQPAGDGSQANPYQIATIADLRWLSETSTAWASGTYYVQTADIDATETQAWNSGAGFSPIGNTTTFFQATYNGQGHTISNLYINRPTTNNVGLFGNIGSWSSHQ